MVTNFAFNSWFEHEATDGHLVIMLNNIDAYQIILIQNLVKLVTQCWATDKSLVGFMLNCSLSLRAIIWWGLQVG
jgi:hypothetical protein